MFCFLVVGGGTSGSVIASRLSEDPGIRVLLLEAGKADDDIFESHVIDTPGLAYSLVGSSVDWKYETEPQQFCCGGLKEQVRISTEITRTWLHMHTQTHSYWDVLTLYVSICFSQKSLGVLQLYCIRNLQRI